MTVAARLHRAASICRQVAQELPGEAAEAARPELESVLRSDTGGDGRLSNLSGGSATVQVSGGAGRADVEAGGNRGAWRILESGTRAHEIRARGKALRTPYGPRRVVNVSGARAKRTWSRGEVPAKAAARRVGKAALARVRQADAMSNEELRFSIVADDMASAALEAVATAAAALEGKDIELGIDGTQLATAADKARAVGEAFSAMAASTQADLEATADAARALGDAVGPALAGQAGAEGLAQIVTNLRQMGMTFAEIKAGAGDLAAGLTSLSGLDISSLPANLQATAEGMANAATQAGTFREAMGQGLGEGVQQLANLVPGLGAISSQLGTVVEQAIAGGTGLGQMALTAGPLAAVGLAVAGISTYLDGIKVEEAFKADVVKDFTASIREGETAVTALGQAFAETGDLAAAVEGGFLGLGKEVQSIVPDLQTLGVSFGEFDRVSKSGAEGIRAWGEQMIASGDKTQGQITAIRDLVAGMEQYGAAADAASAAEALRQMALQDTGLAAESLALAWTQLTKEQAANDPARQEQLYGSLADQLSNGVAPSVEKVTALMRQFGITDVEVLEHANALVEERAAKAAELAEAEAKVAEAARESAAAWKESADAMSEAAFDEMLTQLNVMTELDFSQLAQNTVGSFDDLKESIGAAAEAGIDFASIDMTPDSVEELRNMPAELGAVTDAISGMRSTIQAELELAFDTGGIQAFTDKAAFFAGEIRTQFTDIFRGMGLSASEAEAQVNELLGDLGLLPEQVQIAIELQRIEEGRAAPESFGSFIDALPMDKQIQIRTAIAEGDINAAVMLLNSELIARGYPPIVLPVDEPVVPPITPPPPVHIPTQFDPPAGGGGEFAAAFGASIPPVHVPTVLDPPKFACRAPAANTGRRSVPASHRSRSRPSWTRPWCRRSRRRHRSRSPPPPTQPPRTHSWQPSRMRHGRHG